jgi:hypothetical protein
MADYERLEKLYQHFMHTRRQYGRCVDVDPGAESIKRNVRL